MTFVLSFRSVVQPSIHEHLLNNPNFGKNYKNRKFKTIELGVFIYQFKRNFLPILKKNSNKHMTVQQHFQKQIIFYQERIFFIVSSISLTLDIKYVKK